MIGALIATLPVSAGPSYVFLAIDHDGGVHRRRRAGEPADQRRHDLPRADLCGVGAALECRGQCRRRRHSVDHARRAGANGPMVAHRRPDRQCRGVCRLPAAAATLSPRRMPLITRRWYDIPLRAGLVATLVAIVVTLSGWVGPGVSGTIALFPVVFTEHHAEFRYLRIGGPATAAVIANSGMGLMGFAPHRGPACRRIAVRLRDRPQSRAYDRGGLEPRPVAVRAEEGCAVSEPSFRDGPKDQTSDVRLHI